MYKRFTVFTEPHVGDPAFQVPVWDTTDSSNPIMYATAEPLLKAYLETRDAKLRADISAEITGRVLDTMGILLTDYLTKVSEREAESAPKVEENPIRDLLLDPRDAK